MSDYFPFDARPFRLRMGVRPLDLDQWLEVDHDYDAHIALKRELVTTRHDEVVAMVDHPLVADAQAELWELVSHAARSPLNDQRLSPIARCTCSTQEDWVLMIDLGAGPVLAAAGVCFPSRWVLADKVGLTNREIHAPIAHYDEHLARPVDQFFDRLSVDRPVWRLNWNLFDDPALFQPVRKGASALDPTSSTLAADAPPVWLRVERQTLRRLPRTGAIAFGIRIHQQPVNSLAEDHDRLAVLGTALRALPADTFAYKDLGHFAEDLLGWIDRRLID